MSQTTTIQTHGQGQGQASQVSAARLTRWLALLLLGAALAGCATGPDAHPRDPLEPLNRGVNRFNDGLDEAVLKPVSTAYVAVIPELVRTGVSNFFANWGDLWSSVNGVLQAQPQLAAENFMRFNINTFLGLGGVLDIATEAGIPRTPLDFGQTLGRWGVPSGPYLVLPLLRPLHRARCHRPLVAVTVRATSMSQNLDHIAQPQQRTPGGAHCGYARQPAARGYLLLEEAALDKYSFTRDAVPAAAAVPERPRGPRGAFRPGLSCREALRNNGYQL
jgi:phospholipid-binding lipoprotein MlaA